jgi:hypothetical protein
LSEELRKLGGEIDTQFTYRPDQMSFASALATVKAEQEAVCGYRLILLKERSMKLADASGAYVEVFVTFGPYPVVTAEQIAADPSLAPPAPPPAPKPQPTNGTIVMTPVPDGTKVVTG